MNAALSESTPQNLAEINSKVHEMQTRTGLSFSKCWSRVREQFPALFGIGPAAHTVSNRATSATSTGPNLQDVQADERQANAIAREIEIIRNRESKISYTAARERVRASKPQLFVRPDRQ